MSEIFEVNTPEVSQIDTNSLELQESTKDFPTILPTEKATQTSSKAVMRRMRQEIVAQPNIQDVLGIAKQYELTFEHIRKNGSQEEQKKLEGILSKYGENGLQRTVTVEFYNYLGIGQEYADEKLVVKLPFEQMPPLSLAILHRDYDAAIFLIEHGISVQEKSNQFFNMKTDLWAKNQPIDLVFQEFDKFRYYFTAVPPETSNANISIFFKDHSGNFDDKAQTLINLIIKKGGFEGQKIFSERFSSSRFETRKAWIEAIRALLDSGLVLKSNFSLFNTLIEDVVEQIDLGEDCSNDQVNPSQDLLELLTLFKDHGMDGADFAKTIVLYRAVYFQDPTLFDFLLDVVKIDPNVRSEDIRFRRYNSPLEAYVTGKYKSEDFYRPEVQRRVNKLLEHGAVNTVDEVRKRCFEEDERRKNDPSPWGTDWW